jgi:hypothetical protein
MKCYSPLILKINFRKKLEYSDSYWNSFWMMAILKVGEVERLKNMSLC